MAANINDKFARVISGTTRPVATTLSAQKLVGATSATVQATTGWDTGTAVHGIMYRVDASNVKIPGSQIDWKAVITGTTLGSFTVTAGTDDTYEVGTVVELSPTAAWGDDMATGLEVAHNQDGTIKDGAISTASKLASDVVITAKILDANVTTAKIADAAVTPAKLIAGTGSSWAWQTWSPTLSNLTQGNGTIEAKYIQIGKTVYFRFTFILGTTSAVGSIPTITLPVTSASYAGSVNGTPIGVVNSYDNGTNNYVGTVIRNSTTVALLRTNQVSGSNIIQANITATVPFTWGSTDELSCWGSYEAA